MQFLAYIEISHYLCSKIKNDIIKIFKSENQNVIIYEPTLDEEEFNGCKIVNDLQEFKNNSSIIMANRVNEELKDVNDKVYTRDLFKNE